MASSFSKILSVVYPYRFLLCIAIVTWCLYGAALGFSFVDYDDNRNVFKNVHFVDHGLAQLGWFWTNPFEGLYIPVPYTLWGLVAAFTGTEFTDSIGGKYPFHPAGFHFLNILFHMLNGFLVWSLLSTLTRCKKAALAGALLFICHPLQIEPVAWVTGLKDLSATAFSFAALVLALQASARHRQGKTIVLDAIVVSIVFTLAIASKPSAVVVPLLIAIVFWLDGQKIAHLPRQIWGIGVALVALGIAFTGITAKLQPVAAIDYGWKERILIPLDALGFYLTKLLVPTDLALPYARPSAMVIATGWESLVWLIPIFIMALIVAFRSIRKFVAIPLLFSLVCLTPVLGFIPYWNQVDTTVADRYVYAAMFGPALVLARLWQTKATATTKLSVVTVLLICSAVSWQHLPVWQNTITLLENTLQHNRTSVTVHERLGLAYLQLNKKEKALEHIERRLQLNPNYPNGWLLVAKHNARESRYSEGLVALIKFLQATAKNSPTAKTTSLSTQLKLVGPLSTETWLAAGFIEVLQGAPALGHDAFLIAITQDPGVAQECYRLVYAFTQKTWDPRVNAALARGFASLEDVLDSEQSILNLSPELRQSISRIIERLPLSPAPGSPPSAQENP